MLFRSNKKFQNFLVENNYCIALDGTRKFKRDYYWAEECLERTEKEKTHYYVYVLEANIVFPNGIVIPLLRGIVPGSYLKQNAKTVFLRFFLFLKKGCVSSESARIPLTKFCSLKYNGEKQVNGLWSRKSGE